MTWFINLFVTLVVVVPVMTLVVWGVYEFLSWLIKIEESKKRKQMREQMITDPYDETNTYDGRPIHILVPDEKGNDITPRPHLCMECKRPVEKGWLCETCNAHLILINQLIVVVRMLDSAITAYFGSTQSDGRGIAMAQIEAKRVLREADQLSQADKKENGDA